MQLYAGTSKQFIDDAVQSGLAEKLRVAFRNRCSAANAPIYLNRAKLVRGTLLLALVDASSRRTRAKTSAE